MSEQISQEHLHHASTLIDEYLTGMTQELLAWLGFDEGERRFLSQTRQRLFQRQEGEGRDFYLTEKQYAWLKTLIDRLQVASHERGRPVIAVNYVMEVPRLGGGRITVAREREIYGGVEEAAAAVLAHLASIKNVQAKLSPLQITVGGEDAAVFVQYQMGPVDREMPERDRAALLDAFSEALGGKLPRLLRQLGPTQTKNKAPSRRKSQGA